MPTITINDSTVELPEDASLTDAVAHTTGRKITPEGTAADGGRLGVAVAVNAAVVPRKQWRNTSLAGGETIAIVTAVQGG